MFHGGGHGRHAEFRFVAGRGNREDRLRLKHLVIGKIGDARQHIGVAAAQGEGGLIGHAPPLSGPLLHRMEERAGERRRAVFLATVSVRRSTAPAAAARIDDFVPFASPSRNLSADAARARFPAIRPRDFCSTDDSKTATLRCLARQERLPAPHRV